MENIVDVALRLIDEKGTVTTKEIIRNLKDKNLKEMKPEHLEANVITDLSIDGRFLLVNKKWALKDNYTMEQIITEQYRSLDSINSLADEEDLDEETTTVVEDIATEIQLDDGDQLENEDAVVIENIEEYDE